MKSEGVANLPASVNDCLAELRGLVADLRTGGAVDNVNATLASVRQITDDVASGQLVDEHPVGHRRRQGRRRQRHHRSAAGLPELMDNLTTLSTRIEALPLEELVASANGVLATADTFLASPGMAEVPPKLTASLEELRAILAELREGGAVANVNATLASADRAADAVTAASSDLPALVARLNEVARRADAVLATVGPNSEINRDTLLLLTEVRDAARSVNALVTRWSAAPTRSSSGDENAPPCPRSRCWRSSPPAARPTYYLLPPPPGGASQASPGRQHRRRRRQPPDLRRRARDRRADRPRTIDLAKRSLWADTPRRAPSPATSPPPSTPASPPGSAPSPGPASTPPASASR